LGIVFEVFDTEQYLSEFLYFAQTHGLYMLPYQCGRMEIKMNFFLTQSPTDIGEVVSNFTDNIKNVINDFSFVDVIDIAILSVILFFAYRFIRSRKAGALLVGIAICFILMFVSFIFDLRATHFIFNEIFQIGIIAVLIIFQPEIRDALERIGSGSIGSLRSLGDHNKKKRQVYQDAITNICNAVIDLSSSKTGALIVISRTTKLDDIIETGTRVNADVSSSLIRNIFYNKAPLHDGAMIIDDARIAAASCLLPLSRRTDVDSDLGTRHRAALGMSESSDAVIIVVSEETGTISIAHDCVLTRNYNYESLKMFLVKKIIGDRTNDRDL